MGLFPENISEFDPFPSRNGHLDELGDLLHPVCRVGPDEPEKVAPAHKITPRIPAVLPEKTLEQGMDAVDLVQGVLGIRQSLGLARWVSLAREAETLDQEGMGIVAVVDERRAIGDMAGEDFRRLPLGWLRTPFRDDDERFPVGRDAYGDLVPGYPAKALPVLLDPFGLVHRDECLIEPYPAGKDDAILASIEDGEDLPDPIKAGGMGIPVVPRGGDDGMEFE